VARSRSTQLSSRSAGEMVAEAPAVGDVKPSRTSASTRPGTSPRRHPSPRHGTGCGPAAGGGGEGVGGERGEAWRAPWRRRSSAEAEEVGLWLEAEGNGEGQMGAGFDLAQVERPIWPFEAGLAPAVRLARPSQAPRPSSCNQTLKNWPKEAMAKLGCQPNTPYVSRKARTIYNLE